MDKIKQRVNRKLGGHRSEGMERTQKISILAARYSRWWLAVVLSGLILVALSGCAGGSNSDSSKTAGSESVSTNQASSDSSVALPEATANVNQPFDTSKIIYSGSISLNTENFQETFDNINNYAVEAGGFVQDSGASYAAAGADVKTNTGTITIRIPSGKFSEAMDKIKSFGTPVSTNVNSTNISQQYQDIQTQVNNLQIEEERLQAYLSQAANVTDLLAIENELNRVRTEIDSLSSTLKNWDTEIAYSTIYVSIYEKELSSTTVKSPFSEITTQIGEGFVTSINIVLYVLAFLVVLIFRLLPFAVIIGLGFFVFIKIRKKYGWRRKKEIRKIDPGPGEEAVVEKKLKEDKNDSDQDQ
jgi:virulence-associated protein VapD